MPDWSAGVANANVRNERSVSVRMQYPGGYSFNVQFGNGLLGDADYTVNEVSALRESLGAASNFAVRSQSETLVNGVAPQNTVANDDAYGPNVTLNMRFQNNDGDTFTATLPGPLKQLFPGDGLIPVTPDAGATAGTPEEIMGALVRDIENLVNNSSLPPNSYVYAGGNRAKRTMKPSSSPDVIPLVEPATDPVQP